MPAGADRGKETHKHNERERERGGGRGRERPRCANPLGIYERMRRKGADNKEMMLAGSGTRCPLSACMLHAGMDLKTPATGILVLSFYVAASHFGLQRWINLHK